MMIFVGVSHLLIMVICLASQCQSELIEETAIETALYGADEVDPHQQLPESYQYIQKKTNDVEVKTRNQSEPGKMASRESSSNHFQVPGRGCSMNLRPNMDGVSFISSVASDSRGEAIFAQLDEQSTIASTGSWCGRAGHNDWIEIQFEEPRLVAGVVTQGSPSHDYWTETYRLLCLSEQGSYEYYSEHGRIKTFNGSSDRNSKVFNIFSETLSCRSILIIPTTWYSKPCLRIDVLHEGCYAPTSHKFVVTSKGAEDGWSCSIRVNGMDKAINGRGFCVVGFDPHSLTFKAATYDTCGDMTGKSAQMSSFLDSLPTYSVVAIAIQDSATCSGEKVHSNIHSRAKGLGAVGTSCEFAHIAERDSFSFIGQKSRRPDWISCQHVRRQRGYAVVHATINTSRRFIVH